MCTIKVILFLTTCLCASLANVKSDYKVFPNVGTYKLHSGRGGVISWHTAYKRCEDEGAHLVVIDTQEEADVIKILYKRARNARGINWMHVGIRDVFSNGTWETIFGEPLAEMGYNKWVRGEPNNRTGYEYCGTVNHDALYNDSNCNGTKGFYNPFVCEKYRYSPFVNEITAA